jgi:hypothetical protein
MTEGGGHGHCEGCCVRQVLKSLRDVGQAARADKRADRMDRESDGLRSKISLKS